MKSSLALLVIFVLGLALSACHPPPRPPRPPHPRGEMMKEKKNAADPRKSVPTGTD